MWLVAISWPKPDAGVEPPFLPLVASDRPELAKRADEPLPGFGER
jgi:hypothetical protein